MTRRLLFLTPQVPYPPQQGTTIRNYNLIALAQENGLLKVATCTPLDPHPMDDLSALYGADVEPVLAPRNEITTLILQENVALRTGRATGTLDFFEQEVNDLGVRKESAFLATQIGGMVSLSRPL